MFKSIKTKIAVSQIGFILLLSTVLGMSTYFLTVRFLKNGQQKNLEYIAEDKADELKSILESKAEKFREILSSEVLNLYLSTGEEKLLLRSFSSYMLEFPVLVFVNKDGLEELKLINARRVENLSDISHTKLFEKIKREPNRVFTSFSTPANNPAEAYMEFAILHRNFFDEFLGIITGKVLLVDLLEEFRGFKIGKTGFLMLIDDKGTILSHPENEKLFHKVDIKGKLSEKILSDSMNKKRGFGRATITGIDSYAAHIPVEKYEWSMFAIMPFKEFIAEPNTMRNFTLGLSLAVLLLGVLASLAIANSISRPLLKLLIATHLVGKGDLLKKVDIKTGDEVESLAQSFNDMVEHLNSSFTLLNKEITERKGAERQLKKLLGERELLLKEIHHRVKNNMQIISSILFFHSAASKDDKVTDIFNQCQQRINSMALVHEKLYETEDFSNINFKEYIETLTMTLFHAYKKDMEDIVLKTGIGNVLIDIDTAVPIGLILNELITNCLKYAFPGERRGEIGITINAVDEDMFELTVKDNGIGLPDGFDLMNVDSMGLRIIRILTEQLQGKIRLNAENGTEFRITFMRKKSKKKTETRGL